MSIAESRRSMGRADRDENLEIEIMMHGSVPQ